ncbi:MAG TPA: hypothetical protein VJN18_26960 [Polyangiaceae bacterium]|nr:hypothetical protein [Polyangiaceae bacterium]
MMVSLAPVAPVGSVVASLGPGCKDFETVPGRCEDHPEVGRDDRHPETRYGLLATAFVLVGVGVPLIVIGAKNEPGHDSTRTATLSTWTRLSGGGFALRVDL